MTISHALFAISCFALLSPHALAQEAPKTSSACVDVEVDGQRTMSYQCLQEKLQEKAAQEALRPAGPNSESITRQAPNQLGMPTPATLSNRMGNALGSSIKPQRPAPTPMPSPLVRP